MKTREGNILGAFSGLLSMVSPAVYRRVDDLDFVAKIAETFSTRVVLVVMGCVDYFLANCLDWLVDQPQ